MSSLEASESYGSGTSGGPGFGNKTTDNDTTYDNSDTRFGTRENTDSYSGGTEYGSGTTAGVGFGNKSAIESGYSQEHDATRYGSARDTGAYAGGTEYGSGATSGPGFGNKTSGNGGGSDDSFAGKIMEKAGNMMHNEGLAEKGREKREEKGYGQSDEQNF